MRVRWLLALAIVIVTLGSPIAPAAGAPTGEGIGTDIRFEGNVIVISVNLVVLIRGDLLDSSIQQDLAAQLQAAADYWNRDLADNPYFDGCFTVKIEVVATFVHPVNRDYDAPGHVIKTYGSSDVGTMADGRQLPNMLDPSGLADPTVDYEGPFEHRVDGFWPPWLFQDTAALAHELGHMFGMGDDYARDENGDTMPLEGRDGTLMDSGTAIDSILAARVGDQILGAGYGDQLPQCWKGTANIASSAVYPEGSGSCQDGWELDFTFGVSDEGTIEGQGKADLTSGPTCPFPVGPSYELYEYRVLGEETVGGFSIRFALETFGPVGGAEYAGFVSMFGFPAPPSGGPPVSVAVSGTSGTGQGSWRFESGNPPATYSAKGKITIECVASCEESAG